MKANDRDQNGDERKTGVLHHSTNRFNPALDNHDLGTENIRASMERAWRWTQPIWTGISGKALDHEPPWFHWTPMGRTWTTIALFCASVGGSALLVNAGGWWHLLLPLTWLMTVSRVRVMQTGLVHHASHGTLSARKAWNNLIAEGISLLAWIQPLEIYARDHTAHHARTATPSDPDLSFIKLVMELLGYKPGMKEAELWRRYWLTLVSPRYHWTYTTARLRANFVEPRPTRRLASWVWAISLLTIAALADAWLPLMLAYLMPVFVLTQMSAWTGLLGLHFWVRISVPEQSAKEEIATVTSARFLGEVAPDSSLRGAGKVWAWTCWTFRMLTVHLFMRLAVVPGDLPSHDWHHWHPKTPDWANAPFARRDALLADAGRLPPYTEVWGVEAAIAETFRRLSELPATARLGDSLSRHAVRSELLGI